MLRRVVLFLLVSIVAVSALAQTRPQERKRYSSLAEATGETNPPRIVEPWDSETSPNLATSDGTIYLGGPTGNVIMRSNTQANGDTVCHTADSSNNWDVVLFSETFTPVRRNATYLQIDWSGQINISTNAQYQSALFQCTVVQGGSSVPCSGTFGIPVIAQDVNGDGLSAWVHYEGYVEIDPNVSTTVEIRLKAFSSLGGSVNACGDTLFLRY